MSVVKNEVYDHKLPKISELKSSFVIFLFDHQNKSLQSMCDCAHAAPLLMLSFGVCPVSADCGGIWRQTHNYRQLLEA